MDRAQLSAKAKRQKLAYMTNEQKKEHKTEQTRIRTQKYRANKKQRTDAQQQQQAEVTSQLDIITNPIETPMSSGLRLTEDQAASLKLNAHPDSQDLGEEVLDNNGVVRISELDRSSEGRQLEETPALIREAARLQTQQVIGVSSPGPEACPQMFSPMIDNREEDRRSTSMFTTRRSVTRRSSEVQSSKILQSVESFHDDRCISESRHSSILKVDKSTALTKIHSHTLSGHNSSNSSVNSNYRTSSSRASIQSKMDRVLQLSRSSSQAFSYPVLSQEEEEIEQAIRKSLGTIERESLDKSGSYRSAFTPQRRNSEEKHIEEAIRESMHATQNKPFGHVRSPRLAFITPSRKSEDEETEQAILKSVHPSLPPSKTDRFTRKDYRDMPDEDNYLKYSKYRPDNEYAKVENPIQRKQSRKSSFKRRGSMIESNRPSVRRQSSMIIGK